jgi:hypothetical protein
VATRMLWQDGKWQDVGDKPIMSSSWKNGSQNNSYNSGYQGYQGYTSKSTTSYFGTACSHDKKAWKPCFELNGLFVFGAAKLDIPDLTKDSPKRLVVNCTGYSATSATSEFVKSAPVGLESLKSPKYLLKVKHDIGDELLLDWDDGKAPRLIPGFWPDLLKQVAE